MTIIVFRIVDQNQRFTLNVLDGYNTSFCISVEYLSSDFSVFYWDEDRFKTFGT